VLIITGVAVYQEITEPDKGIIYQKTYHAAYWWTSCHQVGKITVCQPMQQPECYEIHYRSGGNNGDACVAPTDYDRYQIGGQYP